MGSFDQLRNQLPRDAAAWLVEKDGDVARVRARVTSYIEPASDSFYC